MIDSACHSRDQCFRAVGLSKLLDYFGVLVKYLFMVEIMFMIRVFQVDLWVITEYQ